MTVKFISSVVTPRDVAIDLSVGKSIDARKGGKKPAIAARKTMNCLSAFRNAVDESSVICSSLRVFDPGEALVSRSGSSNRECSVERG